MSKVGWFNRKRKKEERHLPVNAASPLSFSSLIAILEPIRDMLKITPLPLLLCVSLALVCLFGTARAQDAASTPTPARDNDSAAGYSSYVSAMKLNDLKETATFSWASVASSGAPRQQAAAEPSNAGSAAAASSSSVSAVHLIASSALIGRTYAD